MTDRFESLSPSISGPAISGFPVAPNDASDLQETTRGLYIGTGGDLAVFMLAGDSLLLKQVPQGIVLPLRVTRVLQTGTTAADIVALV
ncbi:hypothetical protein DTW90_07180 [Neorhizobium sp. P12A]|jgi:hypothetical protein|uniref:spike base protein, RCAP_Rcc01079 family n=1 Tax=Rhizobium/Agrobacterium group TaxID=227290 RepID=UPI00104B61A0|nr:MULTISPECIES: hypothetical protein [Rhizobium/Agrobacterium group]KAA0700020.1 hypothetical protein DTW90_07180 [Neorhizobium sp. P12A]TCR90741.1 hypothetical protein EV561_103132 [Rhizobium sp. BK376]